MSPQPEQLSETEEHLLRRAIELSAQAVANGNLPFGALFADADGNILLEAETTGTSDGNVLYHAETNLMHDAIGALTDEERASGTLYSSCEPCPMCAGTIYWGGVSRVVFGLGERSLYEIAGAQSTTPVAIFGGCRLILEGGTRDIEVIGPCLEVEAAVAHEGRWVDW
ncbi:MAG: nucleoside deaminase [bacterium]|nr:nucleoside deaminase [bacterium]